MALRWLEGFGSADNTALLGRLYDTLVGSGTTDTSTTYAGAAAMRSSTLELRTKALVGAATDTWVVGFAFRGNSATAFSGATAGVRLRNSDGEQVRLEVVDAAPANPKPGGVYYAWRLVRGATELARTTTTWVLSSEDDAWTYFEVKFVVSDASGSVELRYKNRSDKAGGFSTATWDNAVTSIDTKEQASAGADRVELSWVSNAQVFFDDIYILDDTGSAPDNDFLNGVLVESQDIDGDGNQTDWVLAGGAVSLLDAWQDTAGTVDNDRRVTSEPLNDVSLGTLSSLDLIHENIVGIRHDHHARMESATGSLTVHFRYRRPGGPAETDGGSYTLSNTADVANSDIQRQDPNTAAAWTRADLDALEVGARNGG